MLKDVIRLPAPDLQTLIYEMKQIIVQLKSSYDVTTLDEFETLIGLFFKQPSAVNEIVQRRRLSKEMVEVIVLLGVSSPILLYLIYLLVNVFVLPELGKSSGTICYSVDPETPADVARDWLQLGIVPAFDLINSLAPSGEQLLTVVPREDTFLCRAEIEILPTQQDVKDRCHNTDAMACAVIGGSTIWVGGYDPLFNHPNCRSYEEIVIHEFEHILGYLHDQDSAIMTTDCQSVVPAEIREDVWGVK